jgi:hypothetical protein
VPVTNVPNLKSPYWRGWLKSEWRCLVPATSFCEWTDSRHKVTHWFALDESRPPFAFAGIWRPWTGERKGETGEHHLFAFLTAESNDSHVSAIKRRSGLSDGFSNRNMVVEVPPLEDHQDNANRFPPPIVLEATKTKAYANEVFKAQTCDSKEYIRRCNMVFSYRRPTS